MERTARSCAASMSASTAGTDRAFGCAWPIGTGESCIAHGNSVNKNRPPVVTRKAESKEKNRNQYTTKGGKTQ